MSEQCPSVRVCFECGFNIWTGSYCDKIILRHKNGNEVTRYLHGGPCTMNFIESTGIDILRMVRPVVSA